MRTLFGGDGSSTCWSANNYRGFAEECVELWMRMRIETAASILIAEALAMVPSGARSRSSSRVTIDARDHEHERQHAHADGSRQIPTCIAPTMRLAPYALEAKILAKNDALAERNRTWFASRQILALNLVSSPGSGKTTLLCRTVVDLSAKHSIYVIEGDQETSRDADGFARPARPRSSSTPAPAAISKPTCWAGRRRAEARTAASVMIENVGNLVCPAIFDLGERAKVAILSVTEGDDKPLKYPHMFRASKLILNKIDLLPYVDFDVPPRSRTRSRSTRRSPCCAFPDAPAKDFEAWYEWLREEVDALRDAAFAKRSAVPIRCCAH